MVQWEPWLAVKLLITHYQGFLTVGGSAQSRLWLIQCSGCKGEGNSLHRSDSVKHRIFQVWQKTAFLLFSSFFCLVWAMVVVLGWCNDDFHPRPLIHIFHKICSKVHLRQKMCFLQAVLISYRLFNPKISRNLHMIFYNHLYSFTHFQVSL